MTELDQAPYHERQVSSKNLEALRRGLRGNDEAVVEIGSEVERQYFTDVIEHPGQYSHDQLLAATFANYSGEAYGNAHWTKEISSWSDDTETMTDYGRLMDAFPEWNQLSLDPGFMTHLPEFMGLLGSGEITATDYADVRQQFKEKLGETTVWRGVTLTDEELATVREQGMVSSLGRAVAESETPVEQFEATALSAYPSEALERHYHNEHQQSPFISVSESKDIAIAVARQYGSNEAGKKLYLFQLKMPTIDVVSYTDHALPMPYQLNSLVQRNPDAGVTVSIDDNEPTHTKWTEGVEHYAYWKIDPEDIVEITQPNVNKSTWNGKTTGTLPN